MGLITLFNMSQDVLDALLNNLDSFEVENNVKFEGNGGLIRDITSITLHMINERKCGTEWGGYLAIDNETRIIIGTCAFKGAPCEMKEVEVACFTFPKFEGKGYGTEMIKQLIEIAKSNGKINAVTAHTQTEKNAQTKILENCGMVCKGEIHDPEDGLVWKWEYKIN